VTQGQGLSAKQVRLCDSFVYIPQYGGGTASLNVTVAASIILQNFAVWAGYQERQREGAKYIVDERPPRTRSKSGFVFNSLSEAMHTSPMVSLRKGVAMRQMQVSCVSHPPVSHVPCEVANRTAFVTT
jgi:tRNA C32,U32 (ribose-2'-O)-methylase TrmJ